VSTVERFRPEISASLPEGWFAKESITLLHPEGTANVIASSEPLSPEIDTEQYAAVQGDLLEKEFPGFELLAFDPKLIFGGRNGFIRRFKWTPPDNQPVTQIQLYYAEGERGYTATATTPSERFAELELVLMDILDGLTIADAAAGRTVAAGAAQNTLTTETGPARGAAA
jgi:hypothetical protein